VFISPREEGLDWHFDAHDVFILQLRGAKRWWVAPNRHLTLPVDQQFSPGTRPSLSHLAAAPGGLPEGPPPDEDVEAIDLVPGSVLYVPRGTWHRTGSLDDLSQSVSVASHAPIVADVVLAQLRAVLLQEEAFRADVCGLTQRGPLAPRARVAVNRALAALPACVRALTAEDVFAAASPVSELPERLTARTRFARNPDVAVSLTEEGDTLHVTAARAGELVGAFECDRAARELVARACAMRGVFSAEAMACEAEGFSADDGCAVLASMLETDLVRVIPFPRGPRTNP
jgi:ribosomal protein L16 Arg81 hydroxylase